MHRDKIDTLNTRRGLVSGVETLINSSRGKNGTRNETRTRKPCLNYQIVTRAANKTTSMVSNMAEWAGIARTTERI